MRNKEKILTIIRETYPISYTDIKTHCSDMDESTLVRNLEKLTLSRDIHRTKRGKNTLYRPGGEYHANIYLSQPPIERQHILFQREFLTSYEPSISHILPLSVERAISDRVREDEIIVMYDRRTESTIIDRYIVDIIYTCSEYQDLGISYRDIESMILRDAIDVSISYSDRQFLRGCKTAIDHIIDNR
jgi:hypothetical protein